MTNKDILDLVEKLKNVDESQMQLINLQKKMIDSLHAAVEILHKRIALLEMESQK